MTNTAIAETATHLHDSTPYQVGPRFVLPKQIQRQTQSRLAAYAGQSRKFADSIVEQSRLEFLFAVHSIYLSIALIILYILMNTNVSSWL